jgi:hypothetical protein
MSFAKRAALVIVLASTLVTQVNAVEPGCECQEKLQTANIKCATDAGADMDKRASCLRDLGNSFRCEGQPDTATACPTMEYQDPFESQWNDFVANQRE